MATVRLHHLTKDYAGKKRETHRVVHAISLEVRDGEFLVLVGPSGCGKSTTLRMIAGLEEISGGTIEIDGQVVNDRPPKDRDIAMVFQNYALYPHMTVKENMAFALRLRGLPDEECAARIRQASAMLGLDAYLERKPKDLSGGQRQRVAVGRAIVRQPKVFLFDEPLSNLDAKMRVSTRAEIVKLHRNLRATMIYVTHDQVEAMTMGDRICVMNEGRIMQIATPHELYERPANLFVAGFIGSPAMNLLPASVRATATGTEFACDGHTLSVTGDLVGHLRDRSGTDVMVGIRPEDLVVGPVGSGALDLEIDSVEYMGAETYLHLKFPDRLLTARVVSGAGATRGQRVGVRFDPSKLHCFDRQTEASVRE
jgi:multiple sugar transport system ATP-binding protein